MSDADRRPQAAKIYSLSSENGRYMLGLHIFVVIPFPLTSLYLILATNFPDSVEVLDKI